MEQNILSRGFRRGAALVLALALALAAAPLSGCSSDKSAEAGGNQSEISQGGNSDRPDMETMPQLPEYVPVDPASAKQAVLEDFVFEDDGKTIHLLKYQGTDDKLLISEDMGNGKKVSLEKGVFTGNTTVTYVKVGPEVILNGAAFAECPSLQEVDLSECKPQFESAYKQVLAAGALEKCDALRRVVIGDLFTVIGSYALAHNPVLTDVVLPSELSAIRAHAFEGCTGLRELDFSRGFAPLLDERVFQDCVSLERFIYGQNTEELRDPSGAFTTQAFSNCFNLNEFQFVEGSRYVIENGILYAGDCLLMAMPGADLGDVTVKEGTKTIAYKAFYKNQTLTSVVIPDSVKVVEPFAFADCVNLSSLDLGKGVEKIEDSGFCGIAVKEVVLPDSVKELACKAFQSRDLEKITLPSGVKFHFCDEIDDLIDVTEYTEVVYDGKTYTSADMNDLNSLLFRS